MRTTAVRRGARALVAVLALTVAGCGGSAISSKDLPRDGSSPVAARSPLTSAFPDVAMKHPGRFKPPLTSPDVLVWSKNPLPAAAVARIAKVPGVSHTVQFSLATFYAEEAQVTYAAVDPATFRAFTPGPTAELQELWNRLADGEIVLRPELRQSLPTANDYVSIGNDEGAKQAHVGAYAVTVERSSIDALVNERWAQKLGMPEGNALLVSTGDKDPEKPQKAIAALLGRSAAVQSLGLTFDSAARVAVLTGGSVANVVGSFTYTANRNGTVNPDPAWIAKFIRTEEVPILGRVTCNKGMLPQLRAALREIQERGLASRIHRGEYGGCYVPRFIANDPSRGLSFHTWGTAVDLNVPGNLRGTKGQIDPEVVKIFQKWGFNWGGYWQYTDPMHFELARIVAVR